MNRHYFSANSLQEVKNVYEELAQAGIPKTHIGVLTNDYAQAEKLHLPDVTSINRSDVVHSIWRGLFVGLVAALAVIAGGFLLGASTPVQWAPIVIFAVVVFGFGGWEGGLLGIHRANRKFARYQKLVEEGKHVLFVDVSKEQESQLETMAKEHDELKHSGKDADIPAWMVELSKYSRA